MYEIENFPQELLNPENAAVLVGILRGIEREALRTSKDGALSQKPHPMGMGSALAHPQITTDFSESLLEFITPPVHRVEDLFTHLQHIHQFAVGELEDEILWASSMPCVLNDDSSIPVAQYGSSNNGKMKTTYRVGLGHRYGRAMQLVSGVHYNFSLPNAFWAWLAQHENSILDLQSYKSEKYFHLIRNFRRNFWLLIYLFGASPSLCESFVANKDHKLDRLNDGHSLYLPYATSLRMGDLGYQSKAQESLYVCYNELDSYLNTLCEAITKPYSEYNDIGEFDINGERKQLNTSILQIENEFYSAIRPKRTAHPGETALSALQNRGVEYIEVRCLDINPFDPLGISKLQVRFIDTFLLYCALKDSPATSNDETRRLLENQKRVVNRGRDPELMLDDLNGGETPLQNWGESLLNALKPVATLLDQVKDTQEHSQSLAEQLEKIQDPSKTPSAKVLNEVIANDASYPDFALSLSRKHTDHLANEPLATSLRERMSEIVEESIAEQKAMEEKSDGDFEGFIKNYYSQYDYCRDCSK